MTVSTRVPERPTRKDGSPSVNRKLIVVILSISMFVTGGCGLIYEYVLSTVSTYVLGNSVEQFSIVIGLMMFMMAVAGWFQRFISDDRLIEKFILVEAVLALAGGFAPIAVYAAFGTLEDHFQLVFYALVLAIGFMIGLEIPLAMRINEKCTDSLGSNIASVWSLDYVGSLVGSLAFALWMIKTFPITQISFIIASANVAVAAATFLFFSYKRLVTGKLVLGTALLVTLCGLGIGYTHNMAWDRSLEQRFYEDPIVLAKTTRYQRLVVTHNRSLAEYRLYINGNLQFSSIDEAIYHEQLVHPAMSLVPDHRRVLILGGGDGLALREVLKYRDVDHVTLVDLDPDMTKLASTDPIFTRLNHNAFHDARVETPNPSGVLDSGKMRTVYQLSDKMEMDKQDERLRPVAEPVAEVQVFNVDADAFIADTGSKWNVIIVDLPDPNSVELAKLYSREFYMKTKRVLAENGMMVIQCTSPYHAKESYLCIKRTLESAGLVTLPYHDNVPSFGDWGWILAWKNTVPESVITKRVGNLASFQVETQYITPPVFRRATAFGKGWLETANNDISTLMHPVILEHYVDEGWKVE